VALVTVALSRCFVFLYEGLNVHIYKATFEILALCYFLVNPVINFVLVIALRTHPELSEIIWSVFIRAIRSFALILIDENIHSA
jgi:hypothetical protein